MSDNRRTNRPDSRQTWDDSDRHAAPARDRNRDHDGSRRGGGGGGGRTYRDGSRDRRGPPRDRSRSPGRRYRDRDDDRDRGSGRDGRRGGSRRYDDRDWRDRRGDDDRRDRRGAPRDSRSRSPAPASLPSRPRNIDDKPSSSRTSAARSPHRDAEPRRTDDRMDKDGKSAPTADHRDGGEPMEDADEDMAAMQAMLGFGGFGSTKGKKVAGNNAGAVKKEKKTEYRQYMNRVGGFNRPLSPSR